MTAYIDGFNLYHGINSANLRHLLWLDVRRLCERLAGKDTELVRVVYCTSRISGKLNHDSDSRAKNRASSKARQDVYLDALIANGGLDILYGHFLDKTKPCLGCNKPWVRFEEKMSDVNIATELLCDAFRGRMDRALVLSGDSDLAPPIRAVQDIVGGIEIRVAFPPNRYSRHLENHATQSFAIYPRNLERSQLPPVVTSRNETKLRRPVEWSKKM